MILKTAPPSVQWSPHDFKNSVTSPTHVSLKRDKTKTLLSKIALLSNSGSRKFPRFCSYTTKRSCSANLDDDEAIGTLSKTNSVSFSHSEFDFLEPIMLGIQPDPPEWPEREANLRSRIERKANSVNLPLSIRMIQKQLLRKEGFRDLGVSEICSIKKAFSSMVSIVFELQNYSLQMRGGVIGENKRDIQASFVWLFRQVYSSTPDLMTHVMILLADFCSQTVASILCPNVVSDEISRVNYQELNSVGEVALWNNMVNEAMEMQRGLWDVGIDREAMKWLVAPVTVDFETEDYVEYSKTNLLYQMSLSQDPDNPLLLCNYAQFLHLVAHDYNRAEECFKRAIRVEPADAESLSQYANFLWLVRKDMWGAEERYLQAIAVEPSNSFHASKYANFLWNTGGEETCFPP